MNDWKSTFIINGFTMVLVSKTVGRNGFPMVFGPKTIGTDGFSSGFEAFKRHFFAAPSVVHLKLQKSENFHEKV